MKGSRSGLFLSELQSGNITILVVDGPTDSATAIDLGYDEIGRPGCLGFEDMIAEVVRQSVHVNTLIIADADEPGQRSAK